MKVQAKFISAGTKVRVANAGPVPHLSAWDDDHQRTSTPVKKRLQQLFFKGDRRLHSQVVYVGSESQRDELRRKNMLKVELRDPAGSRIIITAPADNVVPA